jgi:hypothetical protein
MTAGRFSDQGIGGHRPPHFETDAIQDPESFMLRLTRIEGHKP